MEYMVSAHGGRYDDTAGIMVPNGFRIVFFINDGYALYNNGLGPNSSGQRNTGQQLYRELKRKNDSAMNYAVEIVEEGNPVYDYSCWNAPEFRRYCGVYSRQSVYEDFTKVIELSSRGDRELRLSRIFNRFKGAPGTIYWLCCRNTCQRPRLP